MIRRWFFIAVVVVLVAGTVLSLPAFWNRPVVGQKPSQVARHWLACVFTATSALTGTGLSPHDIGDDFNRAGQALILGYMQAGGLGVLVLGSVLGWKFRRRMGWGSADEDTSGVGLLRLIAFACVLMLFLEAAGAEVLYYAGDADSGERLDTLFTAVFHSVSAFCNNGLTLTRESLISSGQTWPPYAVFLPLMVAGGIGGPVLYELWRKLWQRASRRAPLSPEARVTLIGSALLIAVGTAAILFVESTPKLQLRNPREHAERLNLEDEQEEGVIEFSADTSQRVERERLRTMSPDRRAAAALFHSISARTTGFHVARLDEQSLAPADRAVMMLLMLVGGGIGGTAGGLRIVFVAILLGTLLKRSRQPIEPEPNGSAAGILPPPHPPAMVRRQDVSAMAVRAAAAIAVAMFLLFAFTALVLIYREAASVEACAFEALSAVCNVGFTDNLTRRLSIEGQVMVILAMLLGRIIPLAMLANHLRPARVQERIAGEAAPPPPVPSRS